MDVLIEENGTLYPIEIKKTASLQNMHFKGFGMLDKLGMPIGHGGVLCLTKAWLPLSEGVDAVPVGYL